MKTIIFGLYLLASVAAFAESHGNGNVRPTVEVRLYTKTPKNVRPEGGFFSKSSVFLKDSKSGKMGLVDSPNILARKAKAIIFEVKGKTYEVEWPNKEGIDISPTVFWFWEIGIDGDGRASKSLFTKLKAMGADLTGETKVDIAGVKAEEITFSEPLVEY